jgi:hypothetical protein
MPLDGQCRAAGHTHAGLIFVSIKTFPQDRSYTGAVTGALAALWTRTGSGKARSFSRNALTSSANAEPGGLKRSHAWRRHGPSRPRELKEAIGPSVLSSGAD